MERNPFFLGGLKKKIGLKGCPTIYLTFRGAIFPTWIPARLLTNRIFPITNASSLQNLGTPAIEYTQKRGEKMDITPIGMNCLRKASNRVQTPKWPLHPLLDWVQEWYGNWTSSAHQQPVFELKRSDSNCKVSSKKKLAIKILGNQRMFPTVNPNRKIVTSGKSWKIRINNASSGRWSQSQKFKPVSIKPEGKVGCTLSTSLSNEFSSKT